MERKASRKRKVLSAILFTALVTIGLWVMFYPALSDLYTRHQIRQEIRQYNEVVAAEKADYSALWQEAEAYNQSLVGKSNHLAAGREEYEMTCEMINPGDSNMLGYVDIPAIHAELPIYRGTEEKQLQSGAGWWVGSSLPTGGESTHCIITAHTGLAKAKLFTDLDQLEEGDRFTITVLDRAMTYEVDQILITEPEDVEPLQIIEGEDHVTLYTCTPYGVNTQRLLVRGQRVKAGAETADGLTQDDDHLSLLGPWSLFLLPMVGLMIWLIRLIRKRVRQKTFGKTEERR